MLGDWSGFDLDRAAHYIVNSQVTCLWDIIGFVMNGHDGAKEAVSVNGRHIRRRNL